MRKQVYEVDNSGYIKEIYVAYVDSDGNILDVDKAHLLSIDPPHGLFKAKWTGVEWVEGMSREQIDELTKAELSPLTDTERIGILEDTINFLLGL